MCKLIYLNKVGLSGFKKGIYEVIDFGYDHYRLVGIGKLGGIWTIRKEDCIELKDVSLSKFLRSI